MSGPDAFIDDVAGAILDGTPVDWSVVESDADESVRGILEELRAIATLRSVTHPPAPEQQPKLEHWGHLRIVELIGRGAFGEVYLAWDTRLDREVALKLLTADPVGDIHPSTVIEEGRLLARVRHPNVVTIYGAERIGNRIGLWMELVTGRTLEQILQGGKTFTPSEVIALGTQISRAIAAVHEAGLLHRDIKAQNVMVAGDGRVVLMDFGTGRELTDGSAEVAGTPFYLAPELFEGGTATVRSDIYSLGVLLYHLLTNSFPVRARGLRELRDAHTRRERTALATARPGLSPKLVRVVERAMTPEPDQRYVTAEALLSDLARLAQRSELVRRGRTAAIAAGILLAVWGVWEARGRQAGGTSPTRSTLASWLPVSLSKASPVEHPVIAVLPFQNLSIEPDSGHITDGLTEELIRVLATVDGLQVKSRTSAFAFQGKERNIRDVGERLGVNLVVEGSILRAGSQLGVIARLAQVEGDVLLWSDRFEGNSTDIFSIRDRIASAVASNLGLRFGARQRKDDVDIDTFVLYRKARARVDRRGRDNAIAAAQLFQQVIERDPEYAPAYAGLADAYAFMSMELVGVSPEKALPLMRQAAVKALQLDPQLAEGHAAMGLVHSRELDWENAQKSFQRALELNPSLTQTYTNYTLSTLLPLHKLTEAEDLLNLARHYDPISLSVRREIAVVLTAAGRYEEAIDHLRAIRAVEPDFQYADLILARALTLAGRLSEALPLWETRKEQPGWRFWMSHAYVLGGRRAEVEQWLNQPDHPFRRAVIYAALGDKDQTFVELERATLTHPHRVVDLLTHPEMAFLRDDPRFAALREKLNLP